jgi:hypothetical protein
MITLLSWEPAKDFGFSSGVSVASEFLRMNDLDCSIQFVRSFWLLDPVALRRVAVRPAS